MLVTAVNKYGASRWAMIAMQLSTGRVGKQCRERWNNHLCPEVKKTEWSADEDRALMQGVAVLGTRWCEIIKAPELCGRTDNSIKNRFYCLQRKMKAKQMGTEVRGSRPGQKQPAPPQTRDERIMYIARELAFETDEINRDLLIEQLTTALHDESDAPQRDDDDLALSPADTADTADLSAHVTALSEENLAELIPDGAPAELAPAHDGVMGAQVAISSAQIAELLEAQLSANDKMASAACKGAREHTIPDDQASLETASLPDLTDDSSSSAASTGSRSPTASPTRAITDDERLHAEPVPMHAEAVPCDVEGLCDALQLPELAAQPAPVPILDVGGPAGGQAR